MTKTMVVVEKKEVAVIGRAAGRFIGLAPSSFPEAGWKIEVSPEEFAAFEIGQRVRVTVEREET